MRREALLVFEGSNVQISALKIMLSLFQVNPFDGEDVRNH